MAGQATALEGQGAGMHATGAVARARITGVGGYQPGEPIGNDVIEELAGELPAEVLEGLSLSLIHI